MPEVRHLAAWQRFHFILQDQSASQTNHQVQKNSSFCLKKKKKSPLLPQFMSDQFQEHPPKLDMKILK